MILFINNYTSLLNSEFQIVNSVPQNFMDVVDIVSDFDFVLTAKFEWHSNFYTVT
ncbi:MAG: hypothetical protein ABI772_10915 [Bacteroidota bacterium]